MGPFLSRRQLLLLAGTGLLTACAPSPRRRLAMPTGLLPKAWLQRLPGDWGVEPWQLQAPATPPRGAALLALSDGWATGLPASSYAPWPAGPASEGLLPQAEALSPWGLPVGFGPWLLVLRDRFDLVGDSWQLLLDPSLRGQLLLPASPRLVIDIARRIGDPAAVLPRLRRQALGFNDRDALTLLLNGTAQAAVVPSGAVVPLLNRDSRLRAVLPREGSVLWWSLLLLPRSGGVLPPPDWLGAPRQSPLLDQLLRAGFTPPCSAPSWRRPWPASALANCCCRRSRCWPAAAPCCRPRRPSARPTQPFGKVQSHRRRPGGAASLWWVSASNSGIGRPRGQRGRQSPQCWQAAALTVSNQWPAWPTMA